MTTERERTSQARAVAYALDLVAGELHARSRAYRPLSRALSAYASTVATGTQPLDVITLVRQIVGLLRDTLKPRVRQRGSQARPARKVRPRPLSPGERVPDSDGLVPSRELEV